MCTVLFIREQLKPERLDTMCSLAVTEVCKFELATVTGTGRDSISDTQGRAWHMRLSDCNTGVGHLRMPAMICPVKLLLLLWQGRCLPLNPCCRVKLQLAGTRDDLKLGSIH
jgi:hypothetical protein